MATLALRDTGDQQAAALAPGPSAGCASMGDSGAEARHRAKVYCLNEDGQWDDRGTGHAAVQYMPVSSPADRPLLLPTLLTL